MITTEIQWYASESGSAQAVKKDKPVKVHVDLEVDDSGYPPVSSEFLWCIPTTHGPYIVDNIPFYAREISMGDEVAADVSKGLLAFRCVLKPSANSTIRVLVKRKEAQEHITSQLTGEGSPSGEYCARITKPALGLL